MVRYTGYADLPQKSVNWVLSVERMTGMTVAPGRFDSRRVCEYSHLELFLVEDRITHLYRPPPISGVHLTENAVCPLLIGVVAFRSDGQVLRKLRVTVDRADTR